MTDPLVDLTSSTQPQYFRFPDEVTGWIELENAGLLDADRNPITASHCHALDVIGTITTGGQWDPETGEQVVAPTVLDGWHVNYMGELPEGWEQYVVSPVNPVRVWA